MPEVPPVSGLARADPSPKEPPQAGTQGPALHERVRDAFAPGGALALGIPDFEPRQAQIEMADATARVFERGGVLLAEAGTGTGKTLAYLVPAILNGERVLVSTGTKNLQEQIYFKDIPALRNAIGVAFTATCMKGRANYLCLHRLEQIKSTETSLTPAAQVYLPIIDEWAGTTETGDRAELDDLPEDIPLWNEISATADTCLGSECPRFDDCFVTKMRQRAAASDLVIVNHHLLCADAAVRQNAYGEVIPACPHAIVDEAHQLEDVATQYFGMSVSTYRLEDLARDVERAAAVSFSGDRRRLDEVTRAVGKLRDHGRALFSEIAYAHRGSGLDSTVRTEERIRATPSTLSAAAEPAAALTGALDLVEAELLLPRAPDAEWDRPEDDELNALAVRARELREALRFLMRAADPEHVYYVEFRGRGVFLRASPIDVSAIIREVLLDRMRTVVMTSATLTVDGRFDYIRGRLGIRHASEVRLESEFDYGRQAILYLPRRMPDPRAPEFPAAAAREVVEILKRTEGRAFVLFTSYAMLRAVQGFAEMALDYPILVQGAAPRSQLLNRFRDTPHSVLLATSSFWQGVDVIGEALSCVIVDKLPFASPGDPITAARIEAVHAQGGNAFSDYQVPLAILALKQGLGRLIRHRRDRGVLAVLDPRLRTKAYGRRFIESLPPAPLVHDLSHVSAFFDQV